MHKTLLEVLREDLGLTGTKHGCELGECGACAVLRRRPAGAVLPGARASSATAATIDDRRGHGRRPTLHPLQAGLRRSRRRAVRLLHAGLPADRQGAARRASPTPTRDEIREALAGNLCRCTGYQQIFEAVEAAADATARRRSAAELTPKTRRSRSSASRCRRVDGRAKVTGQTRFADDLDAAAHGALQAAALDRMPHARIVRIDVSRAPRASRRATSVLDRHATSRSPTASCPVSQDEHALCPDTRALRRRPGGRGRRRRRG